MKFSVIIPFKNSESTLSKCIQSITSQTYNQDDYEIICVDNASTDSSKDIIDKFIKRYPKLIKVITSNANTVSGVRNDGAAVAKGEFLAFLDSDCVAPTWWLIEALKMVAKSYEVFGGGYVRDKDDYSWIKIWDNVMQIKESGNVKWLPAGNLFIKQSIFNTIAGFDRKLVTSEDIDICFRVIRQGYNIIYNPKLDVLHLGEPKNLKEFFKKELWRGKGVLSLCIKYKCKVGLKPILLAIYSLIYALGLLMFLFLKPDLFVFWFIVGFFPFLLLGMKKGNSIKDKIQLGFLYFIYGIARAAAIFVRS